MIDEELLKVVAAQAMKVNVRNRRRAAGSFAAIEDGQLAKEIARLQFCQRNFLYIFVVNPNAHRTFFEDVQSVPTIMLVKDCVAGFKIYLIDFFVQALEFFRVKAFEEGDASQALRFIAQEIGRA